jgi:hypothetical protein
MSELFGGVLDEADEAVASDEPASEIPDSEARPTTPFEEPPRYMGAEPDQAIQPMSDETRSNLNSNLSHVNYMQARHVNVTGVRNSNLDNFSSRAGSMIYDDFEPSARQMADLQVPYYRGAQESSQAIRAGQPVPSSYTIDPEQSWRPMNSDMRNDYRTLIRSATRLQQQHLSAFNTRNANLDNYISRASGAVQANRIMSRAQMDDLNQSYFKGGEEASLALRGRSPAEPPPTDPVQSSGPTETDQSGEQMSSATRNNLESDLDNATTLQGRHLSAVGSRNINLDNHVSEASRLLQADREPSAAQRANLNMSLYRGAQEVNNATRVRASEDRILNPPPPYNDPSTAPPYSRGGASDVQADGITDDYDGAPEEEDEDDLAQEDADDQDEDEDEDELDQGNEYGGEQEQDLEESNQGEDETDPNQGGSDDDQDEDEDQGGDDVTRSESAAGPAQDQAGSGQSTQNQTGGNTSQGPSGSVPAETQDGSNSTPTQTQNGSTTTPTQNTAGTTPAQNASGTSAGQIGTGQSTQGQSGSGSA